MKQIPKKAKAETRSAEENILQETPQNAYYENVSARLGIAQVVLYLSLLAFVVLAFFANTELITYQNFYHFFKDLNASAERVDIFTTTSLSYPTAGEQSFTLYRKGLAVAGNNSVTIFTATGRQTLSSSISYQNPVAVGTGKYLLVYELGGTQYSLYSSYTQMHTGSSEYPIYGAAVSDSGKYALISTSQSYTSVVSLYNDRFALINRYNRTGYVMDVAVDAKGESIGILTSSPSHGAFQTTFLLARTGESTAIADIPIGNAVGISCSFTASGDCAVLCNDGVSYVTARGTVEKRMDFEGATVISAELGKSGVAVSLKKSQISRENMIIVFDKTGKIVYNEAVTEEVGQLAYVDDTVYWMTADGVSRLRLSNRTVDHIACNTDQRILLAIDEDDVLTCSPQKAEYVGFRS